MPDSFDYVLSRHGELLRGQARWGYSVFPSLQAGYLEIEDVEQEGRMILWNCWKQHDEALASLRTYFVFCFRRAILGMAIRFSRPDQSPYTIGDGFILNSPYNWNPDTDQKDHWLRDHGEWDGEMEFNILLSDAAKSLTPTEQRVLRVMVRGGVRGRIDSSQVLDQDIAVAAEVSRATVTVMKRKVRQSLIPAGRRRG